MAVPTSSALASITTKVWPSTGIELIVQVTAPPPGVQLNPGPALLIVNVPGSALKLPGSAQFMVTPLAGFFPVLSTKMDQLPTPESGTVESAMSVTSRVVPNGGLVTATTVPVRPGQFGGHPVWLGPP